MEKKSFESAGLSRRRFLSLAGLTGAAALGTAALGGCTQAKTEVAPTASASSTGSTDPIPPVSAPASWTHEADVVVCGSGGGLAAALRSAQLGNKVVVLEKKTTWGGSSIESDMFAIAGSKVQTKLYTEYAQMLEAAGDPMAGYMAQFAQMPSEMLIDMFVGGSILRDGSAENTRPDGTVGPMLVAGNAPLNYAIANGGRDFVDWLADDYGFEWDVVHYDGSAGFLFGLAPKGSETGGFVARANYGVFETMYNECIKAGVQFLFNTPMTALVVEDGKVVGVKGESTDGEVFVKASKGVVVATGGMAQSPEMMARYIPSFATRGMSSTCCGANDGDGIRTMWGIGAPMQGFDTYCSFSGGVDDGLDFHYLYDGAVQMSRQPWLHINVKGERIPYFTHETLGAGYQSEVLMQQPGGYGFVVFDDNYEDIAWEWETQGYTPQLCIHLMWPEGEGEKTWQTGGNYNRLPEGLCDHDWRIGFKRGIEDGYIFKCNTLEELAGKLGMNPTLLKNAVDRWNAACAAGVDEEYHMHPTWLKAITKAPFYGMKTGAIIFGTWCGVSVDTDCRVIGSDGMPVPGLYAVGECVGSTIGDCSNGLATGPCGCVGHTCATAFIAANAIG